MNCCTKLLDQKLLKLNPRKTEFMILGNFTLRKKVAHIFPIEPPKHNFAEIDPILGVAFNTASLLKKNISQIFVNHLSICHIRDLRRIRIHMKKTTIIYLDNAQVSSRLDHCDSLLFGCSEKCKTSLQRAQNFLVRVMTRSSRLSEHWLLLNQVLNLNWAFSHIKH